MSSSVVLTRWLLHSLPDVISIAKTDENFRLLYDIKGRFVLHRITPEEARVSRTLFMDVAFLASNEDGGIAGLFGRQMVSSLRKKMAMWWGRLHNCCRVGS